MKNIYDEVVQNKTCIVIGHSMGGAIAVHLAQEAPACGLIVIDVVEGTAIDALPAMEALLRQVFTDSDWRKFFRSSRSVSDRFWSVDPGVSDRKTFLRGRPNHFKNKAHAVEWALK